MTSNSQLSLHHLSKSYENIEAVADLSLSIEAGELFGLLGPSGCGKTTTLRLIAGLETPDDGAVFFQGQDYTRLPARARRFGMVFQHHALFPHLDVYENVAFGLRAGPHPRREIPERVGRALALVRLPGRERRRVAELSGGERQRVAMARAIVLEPPVLLFDEPFANLDAALRAETRAELRALIKNINLTALYVTHDQDEAFALCDRVAVMNAGRLRQIGDARTLYERPVDSFVARFLGRHNIIRIESVSDGQTPRFKIAEGGHWLVVGGDDSPLTSLPTTNLVLAIRPEHVEIYPAPPPGENVLFARVEEVRFMGATTLVELSALGLKLIALALAVPAGIRPGAECFVRLPPPKISLVPE